MKVISYCVVIILLILGISFAILNANSVVFNYYVGVISLPLSFLLLIAFLIGILIGLLFTLIVYWKFKRKLKRQQRDLALAQEEISNLRAIPLAGQD